MKRIGMSLVAATASMILAFVGCGASGSTGFDDGDASAPGSTRRANGDAAIDSSRSTQSDASADAEMTAFDGSDANVDAGPAPFCTHNAGGSCGAISESDTFTGTATETSPVTGAPQALTLTLTGDGIAKCWTFNQGYANVEATTNLWGALATDPGNPSTFSFGLGGGSIVLKPPADASSCAAGGFGELVATALEKGTHFSGTFCDNGISYDIELDPPAGTEPCIALPNCVYSDHPESTNCGGSIDGYPDAIYQCNGTSTPPTFVQTCGTGTQCELIGKDEIAACE